MNEMTLELPQVPQIEGLRCEDHATFVAPYAQKEAFIAYWAQHGLKPLKTTFITREFPAEHIALVDNPDRKGACERMIGLSVSKDPESPINKSIKLHGGYRLRDGQILPGKLQHVAYDVDPAISMEEIYKELICLGVKFMTPVLKYEDKTGATLEQLFVAPESPFGSFAEIIRRGLGKDGEPFQGFNTEQIDTLYRFYNHHGETLRRASR